MLAVVIIIKALHIFMSLVTISKVITDEESSSKDTIHIQAFKLLVVEMTSRDRENNCGSDGKEQLHYRFSGDTETLWENRSFSFFMPII